MIFKDGTKVIVNETYIGRTPEIQKFYNEFSRIRKPYIGSKKVPTAKECKVLEDYCKKIFGFDKIFIDIIIDDNMNAFTYPVTYNIFLNPDKYIITTRDGGYKFSKDSKINCYSVITRGLFNSIHITDEEVFAIYLHEIGHSFTTRGKYGLELSKIIVFSDVITVAYDLVTLVMNNPLLVPAQIEELILRTNIGKDVKISINDIIRTGTFNNAKLGYYSIKNLYNVILNSFIYTITIPMTAIMSVPIRVLTWIFELFGKIFNNPKRVQEYISDDFAVIYGFGPELESALYKITDKKYDKSNIVKHTFLNSNTPLANFATFLDKTLYEFSWTLGVYPSNNKRAHQMRKTLIHELDNIDIKSKLKDEIRDDIYRMCKNAEYIADKQDYMIKNKDDAILAMKKIISANDGKYNANWIEKIFIDTNSLDDSFDHFNID